MASNTGSRQFWTRDLIIEAIRRYVREYGEIPPSKALTTNRRPEYMPTTATIRERFGSYNAAIRASGYRPRSRGAAGHIIPPERDCNGRFLRN